MTDKIRLLAKDIEIHAGDFRLLSAVNFELSNGHAIILRGANGIGKTSLLKVLAGLHRPASGSVSVSPTTEYSLTEISHFFGHKHGVKDHQTINQNLRFFSQFYGASQKKFEDTVSSLSLKKLLHLPVRLLSAGQKQRAAFARLLLTDRSLWLLDEPTASLDTQTGDLIQSLCRTHLENGGMIVAATHAPFLAESGFARTIELQQFVPDQRWVEPV